MATSDSTQESTRFALTRPGLLAVGVMVVLLAILTLPLKRLMVYFFKDV